MKSVASCLLPWQVHFDAIALATNSSSSESSNDGGPAPNFLLLSLLESIRSQAIFRFTCCVFLCVDALSLFSNNLRLSSLSFSALFPPQSRTFFSLKAGLNVFPASGQWLLFYPQPSVSFLAFSTGRCLPPPQSFFALI